MQGAIRFGSFILAISLSATSAHAAPEIAGWLAPNRSTAGGGELTIFGTGFDAGSSPQVLLGAQGLLVTMWTDIEIRSIIPAGQGTNLTISVIAGGESDLAADPFSYAAPVVIGMMPNTGLVTGGNTVTLQGMNFGLTPQVLVDGIDTGSIVSHTHTTIDFTMPAGDPGLAGVQVEVAGQLSNVVNYTYTTPPIVIQQAAPLSLHTEGGEMLIVGQNLGPEAHVTIGGASVQILENLPDYLRIVAPPGVGLGRTLRVQRDEHSVDLPGAVNYFPPLITGFGAPALGRVSIFGADFGPLQPLVTFNAAPVIVTAFDHRSVEVMLPALKGPANVVVITGAQSSNTALFTPPSTCAGDINGDGQVDAADLALLLGAWGLCL